MPKNFEQMKIGDGEYSFTFLVPQGGFNKLSRTTAAAIGSTPTLGGLPAQQYTGMASDRITVEGILFPLLHKTDDSLFKLRLLQEKGFAYIISTFGGILGSYRIAEISNVNERLLGDGLAQKISFTVSFIRAEK